MSDKHYPTAPTESSDPASRNTAAVTPIPAETPATADNYQTSHAAKYNLRVERDPTVTPDSAETAMAQLRAAGIGAPSAGLDAKMAAQRDARMAELANFNTHPEMSTSRPMQEQTQDAPPPVRPANAKTSKAQNAKAPQPKAPNNKIVGRFTAMLVRNKQQQQLQGAGVKPKAPSR